MRKQIISSAVLLAGLAACSGDQLQISNPNEPDVARSYATPALVEGVIGGLGVLINNPQRASSSINTQAKILAGENFATVANFGMAARAAIPRNIISNELANDNQTDNIANWNSFSIASRTASNAIGAIDGLIKSGKTLGSPAQDARARAFGYLILGEALGNLSLGYDSAAIVTPTLGTSEIPPLSGAAAVSVAAIAYLDSAINIANSANASNGVNGFPLPAAWINGQTVTKDAFVRLARAYKARYRAGVARNAAQRAAVNWTAVIADATQSLLADWTVTLSPSAGWTAGYDANQALVTGGWSAMPMYYYGMADVSGAYDTWLQTARDSRRAFLLVTPDKRWPQGTTRAAQQAQATSNVLPAGVYFRNRPTGDDVPAPGWGESQYDNRRWGFINVASNTGPYVDVSKTEIDMLAAEGYIRTGNIPAAAALIDLTRVKNGLSSVANVTSATAPISTDLSSCVPRVPQAPSFTTTACGTIFEAMKYEKRMETSFTGYLVWYADNRGWNDLVENTVIEWPVPYQEMQARQTKYYNGTVRAPKGTYGF